MLHGGGGGGGGGEGGVKVFSWVVIFQNEFNMKRQSSICQDKCLS
jgi:hypothetical protein